MKLLIKLSVISTCAFLMAIYLQGEELVDNPTPSLEEISKRLETLETTVEKISTRIGAIEESLAESQQKTGREMADSPEKAELANETDPITVTIANKTFEEGRFEDSIWWDATYSSNLKKTARSIKGVLQFCDLFGDPKFQISVTVDRRISPEASITTPGVGFNYNQFMSEHKWMRSTDLVDMTFKFKLTHALYTDGTIEKF